MKIPKLLLQAMLISVTAGTLASCEKQNPDEEKAKTEEQKKKTSADNCPGCGLG